MILIVVGLLEAEDPLVVTPPVQSGIPHIRSDQKANTVTSKTVQACIFGGRYTSIKMMLACLVFRVRATTRARKVRWDPGLHARLMSLSSALHRGLTDSRLEPSSLRDCAR